MTNLLKIENQIQLTYIAEEMIKNLHKQVDTFKVHELIVSNVNTQGEEETRISPVYYFVCPKLDKVCELGISVDHQAMHLTLAVKHKKLLSCQYLCLGIRNRMPPLH
jgi:hypothetical protein